MLMSYKISVPFHSGAHDQSGTEQDMKTVHVFGYTVIYHFGLIKLLLDDLDALYEMVYLIHNLYFLFLDFFNNLNNIRIFFLIYFLP